MLLVRHRHRLLLPSSSSLRSATDTILFICRRGLGIGIGGGGIFTTTSAATMMSTKTSSVQNDNNDNEDYYYVFDPPKIPSLPIVGFEGNANNKRFPIHRIYCVGRNYLEHVKEMGNNIPSERSSPTFFMKPPDAIVESGSQIKYPLSTTNLHYEVELVIAIQTKRHNDNNFDFDNNNDRKDDNNKQIISIDEAQSFIYGYGVGIDLTKRDLQSQLKQTGSPWDISKGFDNSAPISPIHPLMSTSSKLNEQKSQKISLEVNGIIKQQAKLGDMIWNTSEIIHELSKYFKLQSGDLIMTGTPSGVGPIKVGDHLVGKIDGLIHPIEITIT